MRRIFNRKNFFRFLTKKRAVLAFKLLGLFLFVLVLVYLVVNSPALFKKLKYKTKIISKEVRQALNSKLDMAVQREGEWLVIPKIDIDAPIIFEDTHDEKEMLENLKNGVIHWPETAFPGEEGNCVITGHSSDFFWRTGNYKTVFALLGELEEGDEIIVYFDQQKFVYKVENKEIVSANSLDILSQNKKEPTLTLFTCWPLGTDLRRLVVEAELE